MSSFEQHEDRKLSWEEFLGLSLQSRHMVFEYGSKTIRGPIQKISKMDSGDFFVQLRWAAEKDGNDSTWKSSNSTDFQLFKGDPPILRPNGQLDFEKAGFNDIATILLPNDVISRPFN